MFDFMLLLKRLSAVLLLWLSGPATGFALVCSVQGSAEQVLRGDLGSTVAIPASLPNGEVVWRSERHTVQVECAREGQQAIAQEVFVYLNPDNLSIGQGIRAGLTLEGVDHFAGRIPTGQVLPVCHEGDSNIEACPRVRFTLGFSVFIQKFGATPPSGMPGELPDYRMFQLGGSAPGPLPGRSLSYVINNLRGLRFIACDAELQVSPETLEFGGLPIRQVVVGKVFERRPFTLTTRRTCDSPFSLDARFRPVTGSLERELLVPTANPSLGIRIVRTANNEIVRYNQLFHLADLPGDTPTATAEFNAELLWQTTRTVPGPFDADVMIDLYYK